MDRLKVQVHGTMLRPNIHRSGNGEAVMHRLLTISALAALAACTATTTQNSRAATADNVRSAGKPQSCVPLMQIRESRVMSDTIIDFHLRDGTVLRNQLPYSCPSLGFEKAFTYETSLSQLCSTDIITVLHQGGGPFRGASCGLGQFQPVTAAPK
jgi:hypothetical protein